MFLSVAPELVVEIEKESEALQMQTPRHIEGFTLSLFRRIFQRNRGH